ncbi:MAG: cation diffusion facilitator family transporter [Trueperaceae bacterium]
MLETSRNRMAYLSLSGAILVLLLKFVAFLLTGSVALLSDAAESMVNVVAAVIVLISVRIALRPADYQHPYGHGKAEVLSSALEGGMILVAAGMILLSTLPRLLQPTALDQPIMGIAVAGIAALVNGSIAFVLQREARRARSEALAANAKHLFTDVWTSVGVVVGVMAVVITGWHVLDPLIAITVVVNILWVGFRVVNRSLSQLLDERLPETEEKQILDVFDAHLEVLGYHRLRSRRAGVGRFAEVDIFVKPTLSVLEAHELVKVLEKAIGAKLPNVVMTIHVEPFEKGRREGTTKPKEEY